MSSAAPTSAECVCTRGGRSADGREPRDAAGSDARSSAWSPWSRAARRRPRGRGAGPRPRAHRPSNAAAICAQWTFARRRRNHAFVGHEELLASEVVIDDGGRRGPGVTTTGAGGSTTFWRFVGGERFGRVDGARRRRRS